MATAEKTWDGKVLFVLRAYGTSWRGLWIHVAVVFVPKVYRMVGRAVVGSIDAW